MSDHYTTKQVILMRTDLKNKQGHKVRSGKLMAQAGHAALMWLSRKLEPIDYAATSKGVFHRAFLTIDEIMWFKTSYAKITLAVDSLEELTALVEAAKKAGLEAHIVVDNGTTEFAVPTTTCAAIGPADSEAINAITGHLKPL